LGIIEKIYTILLSFVDDFAYCTITKAIFVICYKINM
jgi:hypothetical protein